jgi:hypothetical protein
MWQEMIKFVGDIKKHRVVDAYQIFYRMKNSGYFAYSAIPPIFEGLTDSPSR